MPINVRHADRDQVFLMPPSMADWLPEGHLAWFIVDVVAELDLTGFSAAYREDGRGGAAYDPSLMLGVLLYAYCVGERSSRRIERRLAEDVAFRVVAANQLPDHATLARFRCRHQEAIAELFGQVLGLCVNEGLVESEVVSIDGTKMEANASAWSNRTRRQLAEEILAEAEEVDRTEDGRFGEARGDELPERFAPGPDRRSRVREALRQIDAQGASDFEAHQVERARREAELGRKLPGRKPSPTGTKGKERIANTTDPDSRMLRARNRFVQGYNAQAAVSDDQVIVAAEVTNAANDTTMLVPMVAASESNLAAAGAPAPTVFTADTGYWSAENLSMETSAELLIPPMPVTKGPSHDHSSIDRRDEVFARVEAGAIKPAEAARELGISLAWAYLLLTGRQHGRGDPAVLRNKMLARLESDEGRALYAKRKVTTEPVFGNIKANLRHRRFSRRGLAAAGSEWRLICSIHNLLKVRKRRLAAG
jgi:transposase